MLLVPTYVSTSPIAGKGLFAARDIAEGEIVWKFVEGFDKRLSPSDVELLPQSERDAVFTWGYLSQRSGQWVLCGDEGRRVNHSDQPNLAGGYDTSRPGDEGYSYALRPIKEGEELTDNYHHYDQSAGRKLSGEVPSPELANAGSRRDAGSQPGA